MKKINFIRHGKPANPYTDYTKLTFTQICDLATDRFTPDIHPDSLSMILEKFTYSELKKFDLILCSFSKRTMQTAKLIQSLGKKRLEIRESENLAEIFFDPSVLMTEKRFLRNGFIEIRKSLFEGMKKGLGADSLNTTLRRVKSLERELRQLPYKNILCVSHSFYMRALRLYFLENLKKGQEISANKLMNTIDHRYLEGFAIHLGRN